MNRKSFWISILFFLVACSTHKKDDTAEKVLGLAILDLLNTPYVRITPVADTFTTQVDHKDGVFTYTATFDPKCSGAPNNVNFYFFRRTMKNANTKLLINFMGGGACWDDANCFGSNTTTYFNQLNSVPDFALDIIFKGVIDQGVGANPFKDYDVIFVPYCTGDLHIGSKSTTYARGTLHHNGYDNVISVLKFVQSAYPQLDNVFVIGQSAGGYGTLLNYPIIRETVTTISSGADVRMLSDASNGIVPTAAYGTGAAFFPKLDSSWGVEHGIGNGSGSSVTISNSNLPQWVNGIGSTYTTTGTPSVDDYFKKVAAEYPNDRIGQYTAIFDGNQRFFYNVMGQINKINAGTITYNDNATNDPNQSGRSYSAIYGDSDGSSLTDGNSSLPNNYTTCDWSKQAISKMKGVQTSAPTNYRYYLAPGDVHTITTYNDMYSLVSGGVNFATWLNDFATGTGSLPNSVQCNDSSGSCVNTNRISNSINNSLGVVTSDGSFPIGQNLFTTCGNAAGLGL